MLICHVHSRTKIAEEWLIDYRICTNPGIFVMETYLIGCNISGTPDPQTPPTSHQTPPTSEQTPPTSDLDNSSVAIPCTESWDEEIDNAANPYDTSYGENPRR